MRLGDLMAHTPRSATKKGTSEAQEKRAAKRYGGKVVKGSGSGMVKGDVRIGRDFLVECKTRLSIPKTWVAILQKATSEALAASREPLVELEVRGLRGVETTWVMVPASTMERLLGSGNG